MACKALHAPSFPSTMGCWAIADGSSRLIVTEPRARTLNGTTQAGPQLERAVRHYVRAYASLHGRRKATEHLGVSRHTLWRFVERGHAGRAVPSAVLSSVGGSVGALKAATFELIIDLEGLRPDPALRHLRQGLEGSAPAAVRHAPGHRGGAVPLRARPRLHAPRPAEEARPSGASWTPCRTT